jgi:hypothetical protein
VLSFIFFKDRPENLLHISLVAWTDEGRVGPLIRKIKNLKKKDRARAIKLARTRVIVPLKTCAARCQLARNETPLAHWASYKRKV